MNAQKVLGEVFKMVEIRSGLLTDIHVYEALSL